MLVGLMLALALVATTQAPSADASVFSNSARWQPRSDGYTVIPVCIAAGSSATEKSPPGVHDQNPSLGDVVGQVRDALRSNWEAYSSVRFVGWQGCAALNQENRRAAVGLKIEPTVDNSSELGTRSKGGITQFRPWSRGPDCITYNSARAVKEYRFACVREYAVHEFGHAIGFMHEWHHPLTPARCSSTRGTTDQLVAASDFSPIYDAAKTYTIVNPHVYDRDSVMTYEPECADRTGERFGSPNLDTWDRLGARTVYPQVPRGPYDVGVIAGVKGSCPEPTEVTIYMDNEDTDNKNESSGWTGAISSGRNTSLEFCKIDGRRLGRLPAPGASGSAIYAVLKLGDTCPRGSTEFVRYHDDQDRPPLNISWMAGEVGPTRQNFDGGTGTELHWCLFTPGLFAASNRFVSGTVSSSSFDQVGGAASQTMRAFPALGFRYGVVAPPNFTKAQRTGSVYTDDEDSNNQNRLKDGTGGALSPGTETLVGRLMEVGRNTRIHTALVPRPAPPADCERSRRC